MDETACSHCGAKGSITETLECFYCDECGWWGTTPDNMIYENDEGYRESGQVPPRPPAL